MRVAVLGLGALLSCAMTATAEAGTLVNADGRLSYTAAPGDRDSVYPRQAAAGEPVVIEVQFVPVTDATGCTRVSGTSLSVTYSCPDAKSVVIDAGDGDDYVSGDISSAPMRVPMTVIGGPGDDSLGGGAAADTLDGGPGDDVITVSAGDTARGGSGIDVARPFFGSNVAANLSLDGVADDGPAGAAANLMPDIESVEYGADGPSTIVGTAAGNVLQGGVGPDAIVGGAGSDTLRGSGGGDVIDARDLDQDRVDCGPGADVALVDQYDQVADSCETVRREIAANPLEDHAPTVSWADTTARLRARPATTLRVNAADDRGVASVTFLDDGRTLCTDAAAPFKCDYRPRAADVGRNTLVALVTDAAGQTASSVRTVEVQRFEPRAVTLRVARRGDRLIATGKVRLPAGLPCAGAVTIRAGGATGTDRIGRGCAYRVVLEARGRPRVTATFTGTETIAARRSQTRRTAR
ncbi:MAG TPA: Ig-like domain-containing protein [Solirubrobacter sp.]